MSLVGIKWKFPDWKGKLEKAREELNLFIAANMQYNRAMLFDNEGNYNGHQKWAPLVLRNGMILSQRGTLRKSMAPNNDGKRPRTGPGTIVRFSEETITIGSSLAYARMMNDGTTKLPGGVLRPTKAKALMIPLPAGKSATEAAKNLKKESIGKREITNRLLILEGELQKAHDPERRARLEEMIKRAKKHLAKGPSSQRFIFRKSVKIPARPFDNWTVEDQAELETALRDKLIEIFSR